MIKYLLSFILLCPFTLFAKMDLVTVPKRDNVQLTIYNSADLTLVREVRKITLKKGINKLQYSWAGTLIDPTSLEMKALKESDKIDVFNLTFPPRTRQLGLWTIKSEVSGEVPFEITYFTSRIGWNAFYHGTLSKDEKSMDLKAYVRVLNNSGEEYANAQTRLIVGKVHMKEMIAYLAQRRNAYGQTVKHYYSKFEEMRDRAKNVKDKMPAFGKGTGAPPPAPQDPKSIVKEGLSEYFLYTIEGKETIPNRWAKRLPSFTTKSIPVVNFYKYDEQQYGKVVKRFISFKNDKEHKLGETPIPNGNIRVFRNLDKEQHLSYVGASSFKYIPVKQKVELDMGVVKDVIVEPVLVNFKKDKFSYDKDGNIDGWNEHRTFKLTIKNTRDVKVKIKVTRNFQNQYWELAKEGDFGEYKKVDLDSVSFEMELGPRSQEEFTYTHTQFQGENRTKK